MEDPLEKRINDLAARLRASRENIYMVCDGAIMQDLKTAFFQIGLDAIPLFVGKLDPSIINAGPWMISVGETNVVAALTLAKRNKVGVCWISDCSFEDMVHHLRGLNIARLPDGSISYFRHYDVDVLAWIAERIDEEQASRLMGPAHGIGLASGVAFGTIIDRPPSLPPPQPGPMTFSESQLLLFEERNNAKSRVAIKDFLRFSFPNELAEETDSDIIRFITLQESHAKAVGLQTEYHIAMWTHVSLATRQSYVGDRSLAEKIRLY